MKQFYSIAKRMRVKLKTSRTRVVMLFLLLMLFTFSADATIHYVNASATGANNGTSWTNAFTSLQSALDVAVSGDEIWVAKGTYKPSKDEFGNSAPTNRRTKSFLLKNGVKLYGGFAGGEATLGSRNVTANKTYLNGDLNGDDVGYTNNGENSYHVLAANALTAGSILDGFIITGGNANNSSGDFLGISNINEYGSGLFIKNVESFLTVQNCVFINNSNSFGLGAIYISDNISNPAFNSCSIVSNRATGIIGKNLILSNSVIANNSGAWCGGIWCNSPNTYSTATIVNCTIFGNTATSSSSNAGGILCWNLGQVNIQNTILRGNTSGNFNVVGNGVSHITYSNIQGGFAGEGNIDEDPYFAKTDDLDGADDIWGTADDGLALIINSPSADEGNNQDIFDGVRTDITGASRIQNTVVNMGAYETVVVKPARTISFDAIPNKVYGDAPFTVNALVNSGPSLTYSIKSGPATISGNTVTITGAGSVVVKVFQPGDDTYAPAKVKQTFTVEKRPITITANALNKIYGNSDPDEFTYEITSGSLLDGDFLQGSLTREDGEQAGIYDIGPGSLNNDNYEITFVPANFTIVKAPLTITADSKTRVQGSANPGLTASYHGFVNGETAADLSSAPTLSTSATQTSPAGVYPITIRGAMADNYDIHYEEGRLTVVFAATSIKVSATSASCKGTNSGALTITATQPGHYSATVSSGATTTTHAFTTSKELTGLGAGTYTVCVSAEGVEDHPVCFTQVISEPKDLSAYLRVHQSERTVTVELQGGNSYQIQLNGQLYQTSNSEITLPLQKGANHLVVSTDKYCQGKVEKEVLLGNDPVVYPNPMKQTLNLYLGNEPVQKASVQMRDLSGKVVYSQSFTEPSQTLQINLPRIASGLYSLQLCLDNQVSTYKIIKQ